MIDLKVKFFKGKLVLYDSKLKCLEDTNMSNTDKYLRDIARELKGILKELQKRNETVIIDANLDSCKVGSISR